MKKSLLFFTLGVMTSLMGRYAIDRMRELQLLSDPIWDGTEFEEW